MNKNNTNNKDNNNSKPHIKPNSGEVATLSKVKIAAFFFFGYFFLPIGWILAVFSAFYQLCLVQGQLSSQARVITAVVCVFFVVAPIPFINIFLYYFKYTQNDRDNVSIKINSLVPLGLLTIFYVWGSIIGFRYYTIPASYEQEQDRQSVRRLEQQELKPALFVARPIADTARGFDPENNDYMYGDNNNNNMPNSASPSGLGGSFGEPGEDGSNSSASPSGSPTHKASAPIGQMMKAEYQARNHDLFAQFTATHKNFDPNNSGTATHSPRASIVFNNNNNNNNTASQQHIRNGNDDEQQQTSSNLASATIPDSAADMALAQQLAQQQLAQQKEEAFNPNLYLSPQQQYAQFLQDKHVVKNAYDLYVLLKEETGRGAGFSMLIGLIGAGLTIGSARAWERFSADAIYKTEPVYTLATVFFVGIFFVFYTTLAFVKHLYTQNIQLVYHLTYLGRGVGDLRSDREVFDNPNENNSEGNDDNDDTGSQLNQSMHYISAKAFSSYESVTDNSPRDSNPYSYAPATARHAGDAAASNSPRTARGGGGGGAARRTANGSMVGSSPGYLPPPPAPYDPELIAAEKHLSSRAAKAVIVELLDPYNITHLRAWEEVRKIAAEQIASPNSVLNSFFTPTVFICAFGGFGVGLYIAVEILFANADIGTFLVASTALSVIFFLYLIAVYMSARETRRFFKVHEFIVSRIAFDVARELEHSVRRTQHGLEYLDTGDDDNEGDNNNNNNSTSTGDFSPLIDSTIVNFSNNNNNNNNNKNNNGAESNNFAYLTNKQQLQMLNGKAHFFHEPPATEQQLTSLFDSVNSLCSMMSVATPRPLFIGMEQRNVRYFLAYVLVVIALLLFFSLLTSMREGKCTKNIRNPQAKSTTTTQSPGMLLSF